LKICITSTGQDLSSPMSPRFGRCPYFLIVDAETQEVGVLENKGVQATRGAGVSAAQIIANSGCEVVITGNVGPNAFHVLNAAGIKIFVDASGKSCEQALKDYNDGDLEEAVGSKPCGPGWGRHRRGAN